MASLKASQDAATAANDELDLSDIEIEDDTVNASNDDMEQSSGNVDPIDKALDWVETEEAAKLFKNPVANTLAIGDALENLGLDMSPFSSINPQDILSQPKGDVVAVLKRAKASGDSQVEEPPTEEGTAAAVEAIETGNTEEVEVNLADVEAAKEELKPEIEKDPQKEARAEELINKVENKKMAPEKKMKALEGVAQINDAFKKAQADIKRRIDASASGNESDMDNLPTQEEILGGAIEAMKTVLKKIQNSSSWDDLASAGIWPTAIKTRKDANQLPEFEEWRTTNLPKVQEKFETLRDSLGTVDLSSDDDSSIANVQSTLADAAATIGTAIQNNDATGDLSGDDSSGAEVTGATDLETIAKILPQLKDKAPNLLKFSGFVKNLAQALRAAEPSNNSDGEEGEPADATGTATSSDTNLDSNKVDNSVSSIADSGGLEESLSGIYLTEEGEAVPPQVDNTADDTTGQPVSVEDAAILKTELEELRKILQPRNINVDELLPQDLKNALAKAPETDVEAEIPTVEEAEEEGQSAAQDDAEMEDARYQDLYIGFKEQMDTFFSLDSKNDGFMDQFLLKYQGAKLAALIGNLDDIIRGDVPKDGDDNSGEARALSRATQQADNNLNEEQGQEISEKGQLELKTRLIAMLKGIKSLKAMMNSYKKNATRSSANPKLDGSALKKSLQRYMSNLQINIKAIVETCYIEHSKLTQTKSDDVDLSQSSGAEPTQPAADNSTQGDTSSQPIAQNEQLYEAILEAIAPALEGVSLMEDAAREEKMELVNTTYDEMEQIYQSSMQSALEKAQKETAMKNASQMMEFAKKEEFIALFPTFTGTFKGKPQTIDQATDAIDGLLRDFIETMKKVIVLAKGATIDETTLSKVIEDLSMMSLMMQNYFGVKSLLDDDMQARVEKMLAQREENQSLSENPKPSTERSSGGIMDKAKDLAGKGLEKLKQMFGWLSDETQEMLDTMQTPIPVFEPMIKAIDLTPKSDEWKNTAIQDASQAAMWFNTLELSEQEALIIYGKNLIDNEAIVSEDSAGRNSFYGAMNSAGVKFQDGKGTRKAFKAAYKAVKQQNKEMAKAIDKLMTNHTDNLVKFFTFAISNPDLSTELFKVLEEIPDTKVPSPKLRNAGEPTVSADVEIDGEEAQTDAELAGEEAKSLDWYKSLEKGEQAAVQSYATNLLNLLRNSDKAQDLNLIDEGYEKFFADLKNKYGSHDVGKEMSKALNSMKGATKSRVMNLMEKQPEQFSQFVYELTTSTDLGDAIFGTAPEQSKSKTASDIDKEQVRKKELIDFISKKFIGMSGDPKRGFAEFLNKYYLPEDVDGNRVVKTGYDKMYSKSKKLSHAQKICLIHWVVEIIKRIEKGLSSGKNVKSEDMHPADYFSVKFRDKLKRLGVSTKGIEGRDLFMIVRDALSSASESDSKLESYWIGQINEKAEETSDMLSTLVRIHRSHKFDGLYAMLFQTLPRTKSENDIIKMYNQVVDHEDRLKTDHDYEYSKSISDTSLDFDDENDSNSKDIEEALKPIIEKMLNEHYNH